MSFPFKFFRRGRLRLPKIEGSPKNIAVDARFLGAGVSGLAEYSESLLAALARLDSHNRYTVFVSHRLRRKLKLGPNFTIAAIRGRPLSFLAALRLSRAIHRDDFDLVHVHFPLHPIFSRDVPTLLTVHDMIPFSHDHGDFGQRMRPWRLFWTYFLYPVSLQHAQYVLCVSAATRRALVKLFPGVQHKSIVVHSGVRESFRAPVEAATLELIRKRLALPQQYVLYSGSTRPDKNVPLTLRVFARLLQNHERFAELRLVLDLSGRAEEMGPVNAVIEQYNLKDNVRVYRELGDEERQVCFKHARALLLLARGEGFGFPVLEAQINGVPVLAAKAGALPEVAGAGGAMLVETDDEDAALAALLRVLDDEELRGKLTAQGLENVENYTWDVTAKNVLQIYDLLFV